MAEEKASYHAETSWIPDQWTFHNEAVAERFDGHVRESLPWYDLATRGVAHFVRAFLPDDGLVLDLGASTGNIGKAIKPVLDERNGSLIAVDNSEEMAALYDGGGELVVSDLVEYVPPRFDVAVLFLVLMFIDPKKRKLILDRLQTAVSAGGAIIIVDRFPNPEGYVGEAIHRLTFRQKKDAGVSLAEIAEKELSLVGRQRPVNNGLFDNYIEWLRVGEFRGLIYPSPEII